MKIELRATTKKVGHTDRFGAPGVRLLHVVEATIEGVTFTHECTSAEQARALVSKLSLGLER